MISENVRILQVRSYQIILEEDEGDAPSLDQLSPAQVS